MTYPHPMDIAEAEDREADKPDKPQHEYDGSQIMSRAACIHCGYKPWVEPYRECHERTD